MGVHSSVSPILLYVCEYSVYLEFDIFGCILHPKDSTKKGLPGSSMRRRSFKENFWLLGLNDSNPPSCSDPATAQRSLETRVSSGIHPCLSMSRPERRIPA